MTRPRRRRARPLPWSGYFYREFEDVSPFAVLYLVIDDQGRGRGVYEVYVN